MPFAYPAESRVDVGKGWTVREGSRRGRVRLRSMAAVERMSGRRRTARHATGAGMRIVNLPWLNRVDAAWLRGDDRRVPRP